MGQLEQKIGELPFSLIGISRNLSNQLLTNPRRLQWQEDETRSEKRGQIDGLADLGMLG